MEAAARRSSDTSEDLSSEVQGITGIKNLQKNYSEDDLSEPLFFYVSPAVLSLPREVPTLALIETKIKLLFRLPPSVDLDHSEIWASDS